MMINSLLDNDFYKFTMQYAVVKLFPKARAKYQFINRGKHVFPEGFAEELRSAIADLSRLHLTPQEKRYFATTCPYIDPTYFDFLQGYRYDPSEVYIEQRGGELRIAIEGYWYRTILWEVPIMSLICELYYRMTDQQRQSDEQVAATARGKIERYRNLGVTIAEFGTRRRHSYVVHRLVVQALRTAGEGTFIGTSNVHMAMLNQTKPIGTHAHEWFMFHAAKYGYKMANLLGLEHWSDVYRGDLGIALSDTYTTDVFFTQFDKKLTKLFDGVRHDSGDPLAFADRAIEHYKRHGIDPLSKTIIFSDGLNEEKVTRITEHCVGRIGFSFGIGTNFTNDVGLTPMNIVIKMTEAFPEEAQWTPVIKLSDEHGKHTGDAETIALAKQILHIPSYAP
ncbi:nicotinate phosphoribosyltransferase [Parapedobacter pyrenivorans]|uniref:Nicotinate phosphoribosyltransferase n=1 Tax=Parapedobacter pyrenivorans TaxID=1305674 RepID=A0A917MDQ5_9SPHI|nr:nicotinate phosphoribosyltransferase [Parapedobacter pyrenivorans]GGG91097.1 nicotinate phosphoribosyltransferase [Parapedobacter pyrenivorans]